MRRLLDLFQEFPKLSRGFEAPHGRIGGFGRNQLSAGPFGRVVTTSTLSEAEELRIITLLKKWGSPSKVHREAPSNHRSIFRHQTCLLAFARSCLLPFSCKPSTTLCGLIKTSLRPHDIKPYQASSQDFTRPSLNPWQKPKQIWGRKRKLK